MSFPAHSDTKESGVPWLGEIPLHWEVWQSRRLFSLRNERTREGDEQLTASQEHGVIPQTMFMELEGRSVVQVILNAEILKHVEPGDFVISMRSFQGGIEFATYGGCISSAYVMLIPSPKIHGPFFKYLLKSETYIQALQSTTNLVRDGQALRFQNFTMVDLPLVPLDEQKAISSFLDVETSKIDGLVSEQRRLIELLKEKRQAVISHAVTKGLNPNAPMKPSGIQWLGDVPQHWPFGKLSYVTSRIGDGLHGTPKYVDESVFRFVNGNNLTEGVITITDTTRCVSEDEFNDHRIELNDGSLLMSINGTIGNLALYNGETVMLGKSAAYINCIQTKLDREFLYWFLRSGFMRFYFEYNVTGTTIYNLSLESIRKIPVPVPQLDEQREIVAYLEERISGFNSLVGDAERAIELLQERRTALISAAVTGKIDVREFATVGAFD